MCIRDRYPVSKITKTVQEIQKEKDLSKRIDLGKGNDEIYTLARTFDGLLETIDAGMQREKQFTSDVAQDVYKRQGPHPFPTIVRDFQAVISKEIKEQIQEKEGRLPDAVIACVGGGSNAIGSFYHFIGDKGVRLIGCEAAGRGIDTFETAATIATGSCLLYTSGAACQDKMELRRVLFILCISHYKSVLFCEILTIDGDINVFPIQFARTHGSCILRNAVVRIFWCCFLGKGADWNQRKHHRSRSQCRKPLFLSQNKKPPSFFSKEIQSPV